MVGKSFEAQLRDFEQMSEADMLAVFQQSVQDVIEDAQTPRGKGGRLPVDLEFLRDSLVSEADGTPAGEGPESYVLAIAQFDIGSTGAFVWTAEYARRRELGFTGTDKLGRYYNEPGAHYAGGAAARWQEFVDRNAEKLR